MDIMYPFYASSDMLPKQDCYIYAECELVAIRRSVNGVPEMNYIHTSYRGSVRCITNAAGAIEEKLSYNAWGFRRDPFTGTVLTYDQLLSTATTRLTARGYTGHEHLDEFGLINMNGRVYDPALGIFLSPDMIVPSSDNTQAFNRYAYCFNNPLAYTDPDGHFPFVIVGMAIAGAYLGGVMANKGELNPIRWNWKEPGTYLSMGIGALAGYVGGYGLVHPGTVNLAIGLITPLGGITLVGNSCNWKFQWTTAAGGSGEVDLSKKTEEDGLGGSRGGQKDLHTIYPTDVLKDWFYSPTGLGIRQNDGHGNGYYGNKRDHKGIIEPHLGLDFLADEGQNVFGVTYGTITFSYHEEFKSYNDQIYNCSYDQAEITPYESSISINTIRLLYIRKADGYRYGVKYSVTPSTVIGTARNIQDIYPGSTTMKDHIHLQIRADIPGIGQKWINPEPFFGFRYINHFGIGTIYSPYASTRY